VTAVGGTNFALSSANVIDAQTTTTPGGAGRRGGGVSGLFERPSYQNGFVVATAGWCPDVAMLADPFPGYEIFCSVKNACTDAGHPDSVEHRSGTSAAARCWREVCLVDQEAAHPTAPGRRSRQIRCSTSSTSSPGAAA